MKKIWLALALLCVFSLVQASEASSSATYSAGGKIGLAIENGGIGPVFGGHLLYNFSLGEAGTIAFYPNLDMWFAFHGNDNYYDPYYNRYYETTTFAMDFNFDGKYSFPLPSRIPFRPYIGLGLSPGFANRTWHDNVNKPHGYTDGDFGMNIFGGVDFSTARMDPFLEFRGKFGSYVDPFTIAFGVNFPL